MALTTTINAFVAGEVSPAFSARTDLSKYALGAATVKNFLVDYTGGLISRSGLQFVGPTRALAGEVKLQRFRSSGNDYLLLFMASRIHVIQNGAYVLETVAIPAVTSITAANPPVITSPAHGLSNGNLVHISGVAGMTELNGRIFRVKNPTANTFELYHANNTSVNATAYTPWASGGTVYAVVEVATSYAGADITSLNITQDQSKLTLTHANYVPQILTFTDAQTWTLAPVAFGPSIAAPASPSIAPANAGTTGIGMAVTALTAEGIESVSSAYALNELAEASSVTTGTPGFLYTWTAVPDAVEYYVYRTLEISVGANVTRAEQLGYVGRAFGPQFNDAYITPDFTKSPPLAVNPFADGAISYITMTAAGTLYAKSDTVTMSGGGSGFVGYPVVNSAGAILGVVVVNGGSGYTSPAITFVTSTGSGATATVSLGAATGNNPAVNARFQQRAVYAGTDNYPMTFWGSRPAEPDNFDTSSIITAGDSYEATLDSLDVQNIRHLIPFRSGMLVMSSSRIDQLSGANGGVVSPINMSITPQVALGVSPVPPVVIETNIIYTPPYGTSVVELSYTAYTKTFSARNVAALASHLFNTPARTIKRFAYADEPHKLLYGVRKDGRLLTLTYAPEQEVYGWTQHYTSGVFDEIETVRESDREVLYAIVVRQVEGAAIRYLECFTPTKFQHVEDYIGLDSALTYALSEISVSGTLSAGTGAGVTLTVTSAATPFLASDVGSILYVLGGKATITGYTSSQVITLSFTRDVVEDEAQGPLTSEINLGKHPLDRKIQYGPAVTNVSGLYHLEGRSVSILADGEEILGRTVVNGQLSPALSVAASKIHVGLPYKCQIKTLPPSSARVSINGKLKNTYATALYLHETKGLATGADFSHLYPVKARSDTDWDNTSGARNDIVSVNLRNSWDREGVVCIEQAQPYPATVLGLALSTELEG